jgi:hypothetical protein
MFLKILAEGLVRSVLGKSTGKELSTRKGMPASLL